MVKDLLFDKGTCDGQGGIALVVATEFIVMGNEAIAMAGTDLSQLTEAIGLSVVGPVGLLFNAAILLFVDALGFAAEAVVGYLGALPFGIGLANKLSKGIVAVAPLAFVGVVHG